jgi:HNH endonuclease
VLAHPLDFNEEIHVFRHNMERDVQKLQSIYNRLDFISETKKTKSRDIKKDKKRVLTNAEKIWVWENKSHKCYICNKHVKKFSEAHFDHTKAHAKKGKTTPANSGITHSLCNKLKGKKSLKEIQVHLGTSTKKQIKVRKRRSISRLEEAFDLTLERFVEGENQYVRIRNMGKTIEACTILCGKQICNWWDNNTSLPRHIYSGGGGNVILPEKTEYTNPVITIMSGKDIIKKMKLNNIVLSNP